MPTTRLLMTFLALVAALGAGCGDSGSTKKAPAPAAPTYTPSPSNSAPSVKPLTRADIDRVEASFVEARKTVEEARTLRLAAEEIERTDGRQAANDKLLAARRLYKKALYDTETWIEPELGEFTRKQIEGYLGSYVNERGRWTKENAGIGKVNAD